MNKLSYTLAFLLFVTLTKTFGQRGDLGDVDYDKEYTLGINKNTNGGLIGGAVLKIATRIDDDKFNFWGIELSNVKNPKEVRYNTVLGSSYIFGKSNHLYVLRPHVGRELILFKKAPNQGVQVSVIGAAGPSIGLIAPYMIQYSINRLETVTEQYDPTRHLSRNNILGTGGVLDGIGQSKIAVGAQAKAAVSFEFGVFKSNVTGLELGYMLEGFTKEIPLIPTAENNQVFQSAYFTFFYGFRR